MTDRNKRAAAESSLHLKKVGVHAHLLQQDLKLGTDPVPAVLAIAGVSGALPAKRGCADVTDSECREPLSGSRRFQEHGRRGWEGISICFRGGGFNACRLEGQRRRYHAFQEPSR